MTKYYKIVVNEDDDTGIDFNAFVDVPAHLKGFIAFGKKQIKYSFNDEKRIVTGVMISAGTPIYRFSQELGEHYVFFEPQTIELIRRKFFKNGFIQNLNKDHDPNQVTNDAFLVDSYIASNSDPKLPNIPEVFEGQNLQDGTWIASYQITSDSLWEEVKSGKFNGFSVEGLFEKQEVKIKTQMGKQKIVKGAFSKVSQVSKWDIEIDQDSVELGSKLTTSYTDHNEDVITNNLQAGEYTLQDGKRILVDSDGIVRFEFKKQIKTNIQMKKQKTSIWDIFKKDAPKADKFASATTAEGVVVTFDGELVEGTPVFIETEGEQMPASEGEHQITLEDGSVKVIVLDAQGLVVSVADVDMNEDETGVSKEEVADAMRSMMSEVNDRFTAIEATNATLVAENAALKSEIESFKMSGKFGASPKQTDNKETRMSIADMIKNAKK